VVFEKIEEQSRKYGSTIIAQKAGHIKTLGARALLSRQGR
jgi:hypothetical protein